MPEKKGKRYRNTKFSEHFKKYTEDIGKNKEVVEKLYNKIPPSLGKSSLTNIIQGYQSGNLLGDKFFITLNSIQVKEHANRFSHILNFLDVPSDSEMIGLARKTFGVDFKYPPTSKFKTFQHLPKVRNPGRP